MTTVSIPELETHLSEFIAQLRPGEVVVITNDDLPVATLSVPASTARQRVPGSARGVFEILTEDDDHLHDFSEYQP